MTKAKRRSVSQKVGKQGELIFETWATAGNFSANKLDDDFGVDFVCQQMLPVGKSVEEVSGRSVFVQVRASSAEKKPRIGFDRVDVETALRHDGVFCLVGVHMTTKQIYYRWLDIPLLQEWVRFLQTDRKTITMRLDTMSSDVNRFSRELTELSRHAQRAKFLRARAEANIESVMPGSILRMNSGSRGDWATVAVPDLLSVVNAGPKDHEALASTMFRPIPYEMGFMEVVAKHRPHKALMSVGELVDGPVYVAGPGDLELELEIAHEGRTARAPFTLRRVKDERAYIGASGLVLRISDCRDCGNGDHVHELTWGVEDEGAVDLPASGQIEFLQLLSPGAKLNEVGRPLIGMESFGLPNLGRSVRAIVDVYSLLELPLDGVKLSDLGDDIFAFNLGVLEALAAEGPPPFPGFVVDLRDEEIVASSWRLCSYRLPITLRMKEHKVLLWVEGEGEAYVVDESVRGLRFLTRDSVEFELTELDVPWDGRATAHTALGGKTLILGKGQPEFASPSTPFPHQATVWARSETTSEDLQTP